MALTQKQIEWLDGFVGVASQQDAHDRNEILRQVYLSRLAKAFMTFRAEYRDAFKIAVQGKRKKVGNLLEVDGTQLDEADIAEFVADLQKEQSETAADLGDRARNFLVEWTETLKGAESPEGERLFSNDDIAAELYTPLVRERLVPETVVGNFYSETQSMIDRTNELYLQGVAKKKEAGELTPKIDRGKELLTLTGGLASAAAGFIGDSGMAEWAGVDPAKVKLAKQILDGAKMATDVGQDLNDLIRNSGFPDAADSLVDNIGNLLGHVVGMAVGDPKLAGQISSGYKAAAGVGKAGIYFAQGDVDSGLAALASGLEAGVKAGDPSGSNKELATATRAVAMGLRGGGKAWKVAEHIKAGNAGGVVDAITEGATSLMKDSFVLAGKEDSKAAKDADQFATWASESMKVGVKVYEAAKAKSIADCVSAILDGVASNLTSILVKANVNGDNAKVIGNAFTAAVRGSDVVACLIQDPPQTEAAFEKLGEGIEKAFAAADPDNDDLQDAGAVISKGFVAVGSKVRLVELYQEEPFDHKKVAAQFEKSMKSVSKFVLHFAPEEDDPEEEDAAVAEILSEFDLDLADSAEQLNDIQEAELERRQAVAAEQDALAAARGDMNPSETLALMEQSSRGELSQSDAAKIDALIQKMIKDRMVIETALKIAQGGAAIAAKFVPMLGGVGNAIKMAANIMAAAERGRDLYHWKKNTKDFQMAQNMLAAASQNFVRNQAEQFSYYTIQAAFEAAQLLGEIAGATGIATAAGKAVVAAAEAAKTCQDLVRDYARKEDLESAWRLTCKAFNNPTNRKLALQARTMNPTLAKYCIAWGAYEKKDPLARNAVRAINLTESSLEHEDTDVDKVVEYMEVYFRDDLSLYREIELHGDWLPSDISLSMKSWSTIKARAQDGAKLKSLDTPKIDALLSDVQSVVNSLAADDVDSAVDAIPTVADARALIKVMDRLAAAFSGYVPDCSDEGKQVFRGVTANLRAQSNNVVAALERRIEHLESPTTATASEA